MDIINAQVLAEQARQYAAMSAGMTEAIQAAGSADAAFADMQHQAVAAASHQTLVTTFIDALPHVTMHSEYNTRSMRRDETVRFCAASIPELRQLRGTTINTTYAQPHHNADAGSWSVDRGRWPSFVIGSTASLATRGEDPVQLLVASAAAEGNPPRLAIVNTWKAEAELLQQLLAEQTLKEPAERELQSMFVPTPEGHLVVEPGIRTVQLDDKVYTRRMARKAAAGAAYYIGGGTIHVSSVTTEPGALQAGLPETYLRWFEVPAHLAHLAMIHGKTEALAVAFESLPNVGATATVEELVARMRAVPAIAS
ncbi:MAG TPA: hypothetical protein VGO07_02855 [Candidatus Saccharimonadales bacterium]|jgi:hypothetical protein|nr:hypothetical protein [Candidatus Saccharimonadales bacterium]